MTSDYTADGHTYTATVEPVGKAMYWYNYYAELFFEGIKVPYEEYQGQIITDSP